MYSTLEQFKKYLGIEPSDTTQDDILTIFLNSAGETINKYCGVKSFIKADYEEEIDVRGIYENDYGLFFYVKNKPVSTVKELGNSAYSGVKGTDYLIVNERELIFQKLPSPSKLGFLQVKYEAGYETVPDDLKLIEMMIASGLYQQHGQEGVSSYRLGDEQIVFGDRASNGGDTDLAYFKAKTLLDKYKNFNLPY